MRITTLSALGLCTLSLSASLTAQIRASLRSATPIGVYAIQANRQDFKSIAANTQITAGSAKVVAAQVGNTHATTMVSWRMRNNIVSADISEQGGVSVSALGGSPSSCGTSPSAPGTRPQPGPHAFLLQIKGPAGSAALVEFWASGGTNGGPADRVPGSYLIDIHNDRRPEFKAGILGNSRNSIGVRFPANGMLDIRLQSEVKLSRSRAGSLLFKSGMSIRISPAPVCIGAPYGASCGPRLVSRVVRSPLGADQLIVELANARAGAAGLLGIGTRQANLRIPGIACPIVVAPLVVAGFNFDRQGTASFRTLLPRQYRYDLRIQAVELNRGALARASNGLHLFCVR